MSYPKLTPIITKEATKPRYLEDRFADVINVKDFGAKGDGVKTITTTTEIVAKPVILVVAGQSNAASTGNIKIQNQNTQDSESYYWHNGIKRWICGVVDPMYPSSRNGFIPKMTSTLRTAKGRPIYIINVAVGATTCSIQNIPSAGTWASVGTLRDRALEIITEAKDKMSLEYDILGTVWLQGESDASGIKRDAETAADYTSCLSDTIEWFKTNIGGKFFIAKIAKYKSDSSYDTYFDTINSILASTAANTADCYIASSAAASFTDDDMHDSWHYTETAYNTIGTELGNFIKNYIVSGSTTTKTTTYDSYTGTDDTTAIRNAVAACPEDGMVLFPKGNYIISNLINISTKGIRLKGEGAVIYQSVDSSTILINANFVTVDDLTLVGSLQGIGVNFQTTSYSRVSNCSLFNFDCAINIGFDINHDKVTFYNSVINNKIYGSRGTAICQSNARFSIIDSNTVKDAGNEFITVNNACYNTIITNNVFTGNCYGCGAIGMDKGDHTIIGNNQFYLENNKYNVPCITFNGTVGSCSACSITGNEFFCFPNSGSNAIWMKGFADSDEGDEGYYGAYNNIIANNIIRKAAIVFRLENKSHHNNIVGNIFFGDTVEKIVDYGTNNTYYEFCDGVFLPSAKSTVLPIPENSGGTVTASADGRFIFTYQSEASPSVGGWAGLQNSDSIDKSRQYVFTGQPLARTFSVDAKKGDTVQVTWPGTLGSASTLTFVYRRHS